jgi:Flp pilus assembly protein TadG
MTRLLQQRRRGERGATIVEAAFVIPLLFLFVLTMVDLGQWAFQTSQATSAARDGARAGIINYATADTGGADFTTIQNSVKARLGGTPGSIQVNVKCVPPDSSTALNNGCGSAVAGCDRIMVTVTWNRAALSPIIGKLFGAATVTGQTAMVIAGAPVAPTGVTTTTAQAPNGCAAL